MVVKSFRQSHPIVLLVYFLSLIILMVIQSHYVLIVSGFISLLILMYQSNYQLFIKTIKYIFFFILLIMITNPLFVSEGIDILYQNRYFTITLQALVYGLVFGILLSNMLLIFSLLKEYMDDNQIIYLFGAILPTLGLVVSMCFNLIDKLKRQYRKIKEANRLLPCQNKLKKQYQMIIILITYAFESSLEMINSMSGRGYGKHPRSNFHLYQFKSDDLLKLLLILMLDGLILFGYLNYYRSFDYYPVIQSYFFNWYDLIFGGGFVGLIILPIVIRGGKEHVSN